MIHNLNNIKNIIIGYIVINIILLVSYFLGLSFIIYIILFIGLNIAVLYLVFISSDKLKKNIKDTRNMLPNSVIKAVDLNQYNIISYDKETYTVDWENEYFIENFTSSLGQDIRDLFDGYFFKTEDKPEYLKYHDKYYEVIQNKQSFILKDVSDYVELMHKYENERDCVIFIKIDNIEDTSSSMDEATYQAVISKTRALISDYTANFDCILRRYKNDSYIIILNYVDFDRMIEAGQKLTDDVRATNVDNNELITLSIGAAYGYESLRETENKAGRALDMALVRGGDQIAVKTKGEDYYFYGGNSEAVEKRSKVKVRLMAKSLESLVIDSSNVVIMPHKNADLDALGAALGLVEFVQINNCQAYICAEYDNLEESTKSAYDTLKIRNFAKLYSEDELLNIVDDNSLIIVVDTSNYELFQSKMLYERIEKRVIIDHHRRSKDFIKNPILAYIEPYASSCVELVVELLSLQTKSFKLSSDIATLMLAGLMVDTSYFTIRTGVRTFEAATLLKEYHADPLRAKEILQISKDTYQMKLEILKDAKFIDDEIALSVYKGQPVTQTLLAQAADELLDLKDVIASFVIAYLDDGRVGISARSNGEFNVQKTLEKIGGGGHLSMAGAQLNEDINEVAKKMEALIEEGVK